MSAFGQRLRASIAAHGLTEAEFARRTGITHANVSHYISGQRAPGLNTLVEMLAALPDEHVRWLITGERK